MSLIISAYNEAGVIRDKLENSLALDYPSQRLEVIVISDASTDGTDVITQEFSHRNVRLFRQKVRQGKSAGLTRFCQQASGEVLVFTDANSMFHVSALTMLVRHFDDPLVGYTVGRQLYEPADQGASANSEGFYWNIELRLKAWESRLSSVVGADGAIYALRRELFEPLAAEDINDFFLPLRVVARGLRGIFEPEAVCYEDAAPDFKGEFRRKYRIVNRSLRAVMKVPAAFNPFRVGWFAFQLVAHKLLRWFGPIFLLVILVTSGIGAAGEVRTTGTERLFSYVLIFQGMGYGLAGLYLLPWFRNVRIVYLAFYFLMVNVAAAVGLGLLVSGHTIGIWKPQR